MTTARDKMRPQTPWFAYKDPQRGTGWFFSVEYEKNPGEKMLWRSGHCYTQKRDALSLAKAVHTILSNGGLVQFV